MQERNTIITGPSNGSVPPLIKNSDLTSMYEQGSINASCDRRKRNSFNKQWVRKRLFQSD